MTKETISCPFSNKACTGCVIYRGRHFYMCFEKTHPGFKLDIVQSTTTSFQRVREKDGKVFEITTDIPTSPKIIFNVEDITEKEEFSQLREKGERNDT